MASIRRWTGLHFATALLALAACQSAHTGGKEPARCPGAIVHDTVLDACAVDLFVLPVLSERLCGMRLLTFGYLDDVQGHHALFPDRSRARAGFVESALTVDSGQAVAPLTDDDLKAHVRVAGIYRCHEPGDPARLGVGEIIVDRVWFTDWPP